MKDTLRAKSTALPEENGTRVLPPSLSHMPCQVCGYDAVFDADWKPGPGLEQNLHRFSCKIGHHSYRAIRRRINR